MYNMAGQIGNPYFCECCNYEAKKKFNYIKHLNTKKHARNFNTEPIDGIVKVELKIKKEKKVKPIMKEMETQTDFEIEVIDTEIEANELVIELENKNAFLEDENCELNNELKEKNNELKEKTEKIEEIMDENIKLNDIINELNNNDDKKIIEELNKDVAGYLFDIKEKDDEIIELKKLLKIKQEIIDNQEEEINRKNTELEPKPELEQEQECKSETKSCDEYDNEMYEFKCASEDSIILNKQELSHQPKLIDFSKVKSKKMIEKLEMEIKNLKNENIKIQMETYDNSSSSEKCKKNKKRNMNVITRTEIKEMCSDININPYLKNYCEKNYDNKIITRKILKSIDLCSYEKNSDKMYLKIFENVMNDIPDNKKPFLCIDAKRHLYNYYDENSETWKMTNKSENMQNFKKYLTCIISDINKSLTQSLLNTKELDDKVFKEIYQKKKDLVFGEEDIHNRLNEFALKFCCNLFDDELKDRFVMHLFVICNKFKDRKCKKSMKKKYYESESDESESDKSESDDDEIEYGCNYDDDD